jgi:hypothetical protein
LIAGYLGDATGDYQLGFTAISGMAVIGALAFWFAQRPQQPNA